MADNTEPLPDSVTTAVDPNEFGATPADDDNSYDAVEAARLANYSAFSTTTGSNQTNTINSSFAGSTQAGSAGTRTASDRDTSVSSNPKPGKRLDNPLGNFSSYTYQLSLYMITPDAYNAFILSGRKNINALTQSGASSGGAFLIAQSGGINNTTSKRAPGFELDYYLDNLKMTSKINGKATQSASNVVNFSFNIIEPYGFSLLTKLKKAQDDLVKMSQLPNAQKQTNPTRHLFILGIRFQGYDKDGNIADSSQYFSQDTLNTSSDRSGVYERFYDVFITKLKFKIATGATIYSVEAQSASVNVGLSVARGIVDIQVPITAGTVKEALVGTGTGVTSLFDTINANQEKLKNEGLVEIPLKYEIKFLGDAESLIGGASLISKADLDKRKLPMSNASKTSEINDSTSNKAVPDVSKRQIKFSPGTPIPQAISNIIKQSSFMEDALSKIELSQTDNGDNESEEQSSTPTISWYNLSTEIESLGFDTKVGDWAYKITYIIQPYTAPVITSPYVKTLKYYGPHKRYEYWFTGQNKEIINYEQQMNNTYFTVTMVEEGDPNSQGGSITRPTQPGKRTDQERQGRVDKGMEAQNSVTTSLYDPGSWARAKITILGDPDYLMREAPDSANAPYNQFYGSDGFTINPNGGQVFIEIVFKEAVDYNTTKGLMDINSQIYMWSYPPNVPNPPKGVVYQLLSVDHFFKDGKFTQTLDATIETFTNVSGTTNDDGSYQRAEDRRLNATPGDVRTDAPGNVANAAIGTSDTSTNASTDNQDLGLTPQSMNVTSGQTTTGTINTDNANNPIIANDDSVQNIGTTQSGRVDTGQESQRETPNVNLNERAPGGI